MEGAVACFGEILLRFAACDGATLRDTAKLDVHVGGAEANVAVALANLGFATRMVSALPNNALGTLALKALRREGVDGDHVVTAEGRMGTYFLTPAAGPRGGEVVYDRVPLAPGGQGLLNASEPIKRLLIYMEPFMSKLQC